VINTILLCSIHCWKVLNQKKGIAGANFWTFSGTGRPSLTHAIWWKKGDDLLGDPPMEEQGLKQCFLILIQAPGILLTHISGE